MQAQISLHIKILNSHLLQVFFRDLKPSLLDGVDREQMKAVSTSPNYGEEIERLLSPQVRGIYEFILDLLSDVALNSNENKMVPKNLSVCVAPNLYRDEETNPMEVMVIQDTVRVFLEAGITWYKSLKC
jgi:hypothetical protein